MSDRSDTNQDTDLWTKYVTLNNKGVDYCTPTAASMVMQYHAKIRHNIKSLYENDSDNGYFSSTNPYVAKWARWLNAKRHRGSGVTGFIDDLESMVNTVIKLPYRVYIEARDNGMHWGWAYSYYTAVWNRWWQFRNMKWYLKRNRPGIYHAPTYTISSTRQNIYHSMPIIGWKTESYSGWCAKRIWPNKNWFLLDTEYGRKEYVRFDSRSRYWKFGAISYIWVY